MIWTHVSDLAIDRMLAGELAACDAAAMRDHAGSCAACGALLDEALAAQRDFRRSAPPLPIVVPRASRRIPANFAAAGAFAAAAVLVALWPRGAANEVRTKGGAIVGTYIDHAGKVRRGTPRETVVAGDRLQLVTTSTERMWFAAISVDGAGTRSVYVEPRAIEPGIEQQIPLAIELDATLGVETVTGVFCAHEFDAHAAPPADCTLDRFTLVKVAR
jgi:hypothetical protein